AKAHAPDVRWVASFATDAPFFPTNLVERLLIAAQAENARIAVAKYGGYTQPVFTLWHVGLAEELRTALVEQGMRKVMAWVHQHPHVLVEFPAQDLDPFFNINTSDDLAKAETLLKKSKNK
ncbi:MAG: molybdenum cofactor guanylyltransferase MobA, partial [Rhodospirillaceae bacterium]